MVSERPIRHQTHTPPLLHLALPLLSPHARPCLQPILQAHRPQQIPTSPQPISQLDARLPKRSTQRLRIRVRPQQRLGQWTARNGELDERSTVRADGDADGKRGAREVVVGERQVGSGVVVRVRQVCAVVVAGVRVGAAREAQRVLGVGESGLFERVPGFVDVVVGGGGVCCYARGGGDSSLLRL